MHVVIGQYSIDMTWKEVVAEFVADAESLKGNVVNMSGVADCKGVSDADEHSRNAGIGRGLGANLNFAVPGYREWIDGKHSDVFSFPFGLPFIWLSYDATETNSDSSQLGVLRLKPSLRHRRLTDAQVTKV